MFTDLQMVNISLRVLARPDQTLLPTMYRQLGQDFDERVLPSICNEVRKFFTLVLNLPASENLVHVLMVNVLKF